MGRYFYHENIQNFLKDSNDSILGVMAHNNSFELGLEQRDSWIEEIKILKGVLEHINKKGDIIFEYTIPRLGKRVDVILLIDGVVFAIEFKVKTGEDSFIVNDKEQVWDYALDLKNFHEESLNRVVVPILVSTDVPDSK